jgi:hypothetical protein
MRGLIILSIILFSAVSLAGGKLSLQANVENEQDVKPLVGLGVYHPLGKSLAFNGWAGFGSQPLEVSEDVNWTTVKGQLDLLLPKDWTISPGYQYAHVWPSDRDRNIFFVKFSYELW